jgi:hypothetical protein
MGELFLAYCQVPVVHIANLFRQTSNVIGDFSASWYIPELPSLYRGEVEKGPPKGAGTPQALSCVTVGD